MVFDMSSKPAKKPTKRPAGKPGRAKWGTEESKMPASDDVEILVSKRDRERLEDRQAEQTRYEFDHFRNMMERVIGSDETLKVQKRRGGELV